jgi:HEAT repeat protein
LLHQKSDGKVRQLVISLLGSIKDGDAVPILIEALDDPDLVEPAASRCQTVFFVCGRPVPCETSVRVTSANALASLMISGRSSASSGGCPGHRHEAAS